ncbi:hypothetical protein DFP72DRAFT_1047842 [Ephemerocybe angulata]|uniref:Uncharacterized protein n=1 Tax=Ephemerocybe angulata TaxID=980116 RepID=A0A8H6HR79_9AGAR|nr:hypothetical protein DFP72DRAFT_1047842 [Tulosesus angulatus]
MAVEEHARHGRSNAGGHTLGMEARGELGGLYTRPARTDQRNVTLLPGVTRESLREGVRLSVASVYLPSSSLSLEESRRQVPSPESIWRAHIDTLISMLSRTTILSPTSHGLGSFVRHDTVSVHHGHSLATDMDADHLNAAHHYSTQAIVASSTFKPSRLPHLLHPFSGSPKMPMSSPASLPTSSYTISRSPEDINFIAMAHSHPDLRPCKRSPFLSDPFPGPPKIQISSLWPVFRTSKNINFKVSRKATYTQPSPLSGHHNNTTSRHVPAPYVVISSKAPLAGSRSIHISSSSPRTRFIVRFPSPDVDPYILCQTEYVWPSIRDVPTTVDRILPQLSLSARPQLSCAPQRSFSDLQISHFQNLRARLAGAAQDAGHPNELYKKCELQDDWKDGD